jgi:hypothetical protein
MQPSEIAKLAMVVYFADWLSRRGARLGNVSYGLVPFAVMLGVVCGLVMLEGDLGTTIVLVVIAGAVYFTAGANPLHILGAAAVAGGAFWAMVKIAPYRQSRIAAWLDPLAYYQDAGWQPMHGLYALGSGGIFGVGWARAARSSCALAGPDRRDLRGDRREFGADRHAVRRRVLPMIAYRDAHRRAGASRCGPAGDRADRLAGLPGADQYRGRDDAAAVHRPHAAVRRFGSSSLVMCMVAVGILLKSRGTRSTGRPRSPPGERARRPPPAGRAWRDAGGMVARPARGSAPAAGAA